MNSHALRRPQHLAVTVAAAGLAIGVPAQAAVADPTAAPSASVAGGALVITGTNAPDAIQIAVGTDPGTLLVDLGQQQTPLVLDRSTFSAIAVRLGNGDDTFAVVTSRGDVTTPLTVDGGNGNDAITGGGGNDLLDGGNGDDAILGGAGVDEISGDNGVDTIDGGVGTDTEFLDNGDDVAVWNPGEGSDIIGGGNGLDTLVFNGSNGDERFDLSANGSSSLFTRNVGTVRMDMDSVEALALATLRGADSVTVHDLSQTSLRHAAIDLSADGLGDGQQDTIVVEGSAGPDHVDVTTDGAAVNVAGLGLETQLTGSESSDQLHVNTGAGDDTVQIGDGVAKLIGVTVDLGTQ